MIYLEIIVLAGLGYLGMREPLKKKWRRDLIVYIVFFVIGSALLILQTAGVKIPFFLDEISKFSKNVLHLK